MECFELPDGAQTGRVYEDAQPLGVDSGLMAVVDPLWVEELLASHAPTGDQDFLDGTDFACTTGGFLCSTGGGGPFEFTTHIHGGTSHAVEMFFDDTHDDTDRWIPAGIIRSGSGNLLIGDPYFLREFVPNLFRPPFTSYGVWSVFLLPGPGWAAIHILKENGRVEQPNRGIRVDWLPF